MKRLFGTIGLTYLTVLAVAFFLPKSAVFLLAAGFLITSCGIVLTVKRFETGKGMLLAGVSAALAVVSIFLYRNYIYQPVVDNYSDKDKYSIIKKDIYERCARGEFDVNTREELLNEAYSRFC